MHYGRTVKLIILKRYSSLKEFAEITGLKKLFVYDITTSKNAKLTIKSRNRLIKALNMTPVEFEQEIELMEKK